MYIPKYFKVTNVDEIWDFVQKKLFWNNCHNRKRKTNRNSFALWIN